MYNDSYLNTLKILHDEYLQKSDEYFSIAFDKENDKERENYLCKSEECLGIASGLSKAMRIYRYYNSQNNS